jgi:hypothetical protein
MDRAFTWASSPRSNIRCIQNKVLSRWYVWRKMCTYLAPTLTLSPNEKSEVSHDPCHLGVPSGSSKMISKTMVRLTQIVDLSCIKISTISKWTKVSLEPHHLGVPSGAPKMISEQLVRLAQTVHLSCTDSNTVSKEKEVRFHMTHIT